MRRAGENCFVYASGTKQGSSRRPSRWFEFPAHGSPTATYSFSPSPYLCIKPRAPGTGAQVSMRRHTEPKSLAPYPEEVRLKRHIRRPDGGIPKGKRQNPALGFRGVS
ncbi:hypothetical protein IMZ48_34965 [Candidatus Bathyarchaeota archaeon]|nr:hypothetical protein [Candidatus Bathyarchaeota archaeon]